ncbi:unnamed protein product, partial [Ceratitis capitata]
MQIRSVVIKRFGTAQHSFCRTGENRPATATPLQPQLQISRHHLQHAIYTHSCEQNRRAAAVTVKKFICNQHENENARQRYAFVVAVV